MERINQVTEAVIGAAIEVHRVLGPGLLEETYKRCLRRELTLRGVAWEHEQKVPVTYKGEVIECGYRADLIVEGCVVVEAKAVEVVLPVHEAQLLTYLRIGRWKVGLLINFNVPKLVDGLTRRVLDFKE